MYNEINKTELVNLLLNTNIKELEEIVEDIHPLDVLELIQEDETLIYILNNLPEWFVAEIIDEAQDEEKMDLLNYFSEHKQKEIVQEMSSDELADLVGILDEEEANKILDKMTEEDAEDVRQLLSYAPDTAGGIMATEFLAIKETMTVKEVLKFLQSEGPDAESAYYLYVIDENEILKGVVSLRDLVTSGFNTFVYDIMNDNVVSVPYDMDQEEVGHIFEKYGFLTMPVVDEINMMLGIVTVDDIMQILRDETTEDIHLLGGVAVSEKVDGRVIDSIRSRLPWLFVNLITAILAAATVNMFEDTINQVVILATFMPIVAGMGGNAGTQALTIIVRGIALGELTFENAKRVLIKEILVGVTNGLALGTAIAILGTIWAGKPVFGIVIGTAMILNMTAATTAGYVVPVVLKKFKIDPALASAVFVTTVTDVLGFFFFLGLATLFISYLI